MVVVVVVVAVYMRENPEEARGNGGWRRGRIFL